MHFPQTAVLLLVTMTFKLELPSNSNSMQIFEELNKLNRLYLFIKIEERHEKIITD